MLATPILRTFNPYNATTQFEFRFDYTGGNQAVRNNLVIQRVNDNAEVYNSIEETFSLRHLLSGNTLQNGVNYRARLRVGDINNNWSQYSDWIIFWCFSEPVITINTIDYANQNRVYNQTVNFQSTYVQFENELLQSYRYLLYDSNQGLIRSFSEKFADGTFSLTQEITGLESGTLYYLEVRTVSPNNQMGTSGLIPFRPFYIAPRLTLALEPQNLPEQGAIKVNANVIQIILKLYDSHGNEINPMNIEYMDNDWIDMTKDDYARLVVDNAFEITQNDFLMQIWLKNVPENKVFLELFSEYGKIQLVKKNNMILAYKIIRDSYLYGYFGSNEMEFSTEDTVMICLKQISHLIDIEVVKL